MKKLEKTSHTALISYQIEAMRRMGNSKKTIVNYLNLRKKIGSFPNTLDYVTSFYDSKVGTSGSLFFDNENKTYLLAFAGTNPIDLKNDILIDIYDIALGQGRHYHSCFRFYRKVSKQYGDNIILVGHSLGGNIAQRVALEFNVKKTIIYNTASLYLVGGVDKFMDLTDSNREDYIKKRRRYHKTVRDIDDRLKHFTGQVIHISSEDDLLNRLLNVVKDEIVSIGQNYILKNGGSHNMTPLIAAHSSLIEKIVADEVIQPHYLAGNYKKISKSESMSIVDKIKNGELFADYVINFLSDNKKVEEISSNLFDDIDISKFTNYFLSRIN